MFRRLLLAGIVVFCLSGTTFAQRYSQFPGVRVLPNNLHAYLSHLQQQRTQSLQLFTEHLEKQYKAGNIPQGILLNVQAIQKKAEFDSATDHKERSKLNAELIKLQQQRLQLDSRSSNRTWYGVDRVKLGTYLQREYQTFARNHPQPVTKPEEPKEESSEK